MQGTDYNWQECETNPQEGAYPSISNNNNSVQWYCFLLYLNLGFKYDVSSHVWGEKRKGGYHAFF